jgi:hypothetical protein
MVVECKSSRRVTFQLANGIKYTGKLALFDAFGSRTRLHILVLPQMGEDGKMSGRERERQCDRSGAHERFARAYLTGGK